MRAEWQLARNLALSSSRRQRWRQVSLLLGTFLAVLVTLSGMSWLGVSQRADSIVHTRAPQWPQPGEEATAMVFGSGIILDGLSQIPLIYIEPLPGGGREALPPGLDRWPEPGEAVISPGVRRQGLTAESFGFLSSDAGSGAGGDIGDEALVSRSEGFLYVRSTEPLPVDDPEAAAFPVAGFGGDNPAFIETEPDVPALRAALGYSIWMVLVPSLFLTASSARAVSHLVDDRATSMWRLGIARPRVRLVVILETLVLAAIGALVGLLTWWLVVPHRTSLPLSDTVLVPGSLYLPWAVVVATVATLVGTSIATAGLGRVGSKPLREPGRRVVTVAGIGHLVGWTVMFLSQPLGQRWGSDGLVVVLAVGFAATVVTFPLAVASASRLLARIPAPVSPAMWTSWQQLRRRPRLLSRPSAQAGLLILVTASAFAIAKGVPTKILHSPWEHEQRSVSLVAWQEGSNFEFTLPTSKDIAVAPVVRGGGGVVLTDCPTALRFVGLDATTRCGSGDLPDDVRATLQEWDLAVFDGQPVPNAVWVSTPTSWSQADVLSLASGAPAVIVEQKVGPVPFSRMTADWVLATWFLGSLVLFAALVRAVGDHLSRSVHEGAILDRIGLSRREVDRVLVSSTLLPLGPSLALAAVGTIIFALRGEGVGYTVASFSIIAAALLGGALLLITMVAAAVHLRTSGRRG